MKDKVKVRSQSEDGSDLYLLSQTLKVRWGLGLLPIGREVRFLPPLRSALFRGPSKNQGEANGKGTRSKPPGYCSMLAIGAKVL